jgi:1-deoxy-D-xylulose-5-phosphate synthase
VIAEMTKQHALIVTIEENALMGGAGAAVMEALQAMQLHCPILCLGLPDTFIEHGVHETMLADCGLNAEGIVKAIQSRLYSLSG